MGFIVYRLSLLFLLLLAAIIIAISGCVGGGESSGAAPPDPVRPAYAPQSYNIDITATPSDGDADLQKTIAISVLPDPLDVAIVNYAGRTFRQGPFQDDYGTNIYRSNNISERTAHNAWDDGPTSFNVPVVSNYS